MFIFGGILNSGSTNELWNINLDKLSTMLNLETVNEVVNENKDNSDDKNISENDVNTNSESRVFDFMKKNKEGRLTQEKKDKNIQMKFSLESLVKNTFDEYGLKIRNDDEISWQTFTSDNGILAKDSHTMLAQNNELLIFGGYWNGCTLSNMLYSVEISNKIKWKLKLSLGEKPRARQGHSALIINNDM